MERDIRAKSRELIELRSEYARLKREERRAPAGEGAQLGASLRAVGDRWQVPREPTAPRTRPAFAPRAAKA